MAMVSTHKSAFKPWRDRLAALKNLPPCLRLLWHTGPALVIATLSFRFIAAMMPLAALWIGKLIIDAVVGSAHHGPTPHIWTLLGAEFGIAAAGSILGRAIEYCDGRLGERFSRDVSVRVMEHAARLDLAS